MAQDAPIHKSTADVVLSRFAPHGRVEMRFEGDILYYDATGPFNKELVESLAVAQRDLLTTANHHGPWVSLSIMRGSLMASPEAFARYSELMHSPRPAHSHLWPLPMWWHLTWRDAL